MSNFSCSLARNIIHTVGRTQLFIADSDERRLYYQFSLPHLYISLWKVVRMYFLNWLFSRSRQVKVISGDDRDNIGTLINIDDKDGIIKMDRTDQLKILPLEFLGKLSTVDIWAGYSPLPLPSLGSFLWNTWASWTLWTFELDTPLSPFPSLPPPSPLYPLPSRITVDIWAPPHPPPFLTISVYPAWQAFPRGKENLSFCSCACILAQIEKPLPTALHSSLEQLLPRVQDGFLFLY